MASWKFLALGILLRLLIATINSFVSPTWGAEGDAAAFNEAAIYLPFGQDHAYAKIFYAGGYQFLPYVQFLIVVYDLTNNSQFIACVLSVIAWSISALALHGMLEMSPATQKAKTVILCIYALIPSSLMLTSVTLREAYQMAVVAIAGYFVVHAYYFGKAMPKLLLAGISLGLGGLLHRSFWAYAGLFVLIAYVFLSSKNESKAPVFKYFLLFGMVFIAAAQGFVKYTEDNYVGNVKSAQAASDEAWAAIGEVGDQAEGLTESVEKYQNVIIGYNARSNYAVKTDIEGVGGLLLHLPILFFGYMMAPMPWQISSVLDIQVLFENLLRVYLVYLIYKGRKRHKNNKIYAPATFLVIAWAALEFAWALGTSNWGTAIRHHLPGLPLLFAAAAYYLYPPKKAY